MTTIVTLTDDTYSANSSDGRKRIYASISCVNPYSTGGESITTSTYFPSKFDGGKVTAVNAAVNIDLVGSASTAVFRSTSASTSTALLQLLNVGLTATTKAGLFVDNTVANISNLTFQVEMIGR